MPFCLLYQKNKRFPHVDGNRSNLLIKKPKSMPCRSGKIFTYSKIAVRKSYRIHIKIRFSCRRHFDISDYFCFYYLNYSAFMPICQAFERRKYVKRSVFSRKTEKFSLSREIREREKERWFYFTPLILFHKLFARSFTSLSKYSITIRRSLVC